MTDARGMNNNVGGTRYVIKIMIPKLVEPANVNRDNAYPASTPANSETTVEAVAIHNVFQAQRVKRVLCKSCHQCESVGCQTKNGAFLALYNSKSGLMEVINIQ